MTGTHPNKDTMTCADFQEKIPELFETHQDLNNEEHLKTCENCSALVRDLEYIAQQAKLLMPIHDPSPGVWDNIQSAIRRDPETEKGSTPASSPARR
jgi:hypothetical protein